MNTKPMLVSDAQVKTQFKEPVLSTSAQEPAQVLLFARKAAQALMDVIASKPNKIMIRNNEYLCYEDWQTLGRFYGVTAGIEWVKTCSNENKVFGYESRAVVYHNGIIISAAIASCFRDEPNWHDKPSFQLKSMAQTRAASKALRNVLAWVAVLGGYKPTPAEEMIGMDSSTPSIEPIEDVEAEIDDTEIENMMIDVENAEWKQSHGITPRQEGFLRSLIVEKIIDEEEREQRLANLGTLSKWEASEVIDELLSSPSLG